jgi:hypothetical protein
VVQVRKLSAFPYGYCCIPLQPALAYANWPKTLVLSEGRDATPTLQEHIYAAGCARVVVGKEYGSILEWGTQQLKADKESTDLWNACVVSVHILNNEDLFIHMLNDTHWELFLRSLDSPH